MITTAELSVFAPGCDAGRLAPALDAACRDHGIDTPRRTAHFMAHLHHESGGFRRLEETLAYSPRRLTEVWPSRFADVKAAQPFAFNPDRLANAVYGGRLGNTLPGDGWRYRGRGFIQLTGRANYARAAAWSGMDLVGDPDLAAQAGPAAQIAGAFWAAEGLNAIVDEDDGERTLAVFETQVRTFEEDDLRHARRVINGGLTGLDEVRRQLIRARAIWR